MKAYLITTGTLFALLALAHLVRTLAEWQRLADDPWFVLEGPVIGIAPARFLSERGACFASRRARDGKVGVRATLIWICTRAGEPQPMRDLAA